MIAGKGGPEAPETQVVERAKVELASNANNWVGGYYEGDPLDPTAPSTYGLMGYLSILHVVYLACMRPYVNASTRVLEIGPGRGAWTRCLSQLGAKEIWALDALSAEHNRFWEYVGRRDGIKYFQVEDSSMSMVPDDHIDYFFSFGCFCHVSPDLIGAYVQNLYGKMTRGAHGFMMIADYDKRNQSMDEVDRLSILRIFDSRAFLGRRYIPVKAVIRAALKLVPPRVGEKLDKNESNEPRADRWYHLGLPRALELLADSGFQVVDQDVGIVPRDPLIHFVKP